MGRGEKRDRASRGELLPFAGDSAGHPKDHPRRPSCRVEEASFTLQSAHQKQSSGWRLTLFKKGEYGPCFNYLAIVFRLPVRALFKELEESD